MHRISTRDTLRITKSNVSQHLRIMREKGVMEYRREGGYVFHWLSNPKIFEACLLVRQVLIEQIEQVGELARLERWT